MYQAACSLALQVVKDYWPLKKCKHESQATVCARGEEKGGRKPGHSFSNLMGGL